MTAAALASRARSARAAEATFGRYTIKEQLGVGGMATVHRVVAHGSSKPLALKRLLSHLAEDPQAVKAFVHEARLASNLRHANVVQTFESGTIDGQHFIAMEYIAGPTLLQVMRQCESAAGAMPLPVIISILCQLCDGLDHAHNLCDDAGKPLGIIHRDVSPANIIVSSSGVVKLIDFGIAKVNASQRTKAGVLKGKFAYIAPEYTLGQLDLRADLFALGVIAYELLSGKPLFQGPSDYDTILRLREMPISPPSRCNPHVSRDLDDIVLTALHRDPNQRWQSAAALRTALTNLARAQGITLGPRTVIDWVTWAFAQKPRKEDSVLVRVIDTLCEPSNATVSLFPRRRAPDPFLDEPSIDFTEPPPPPPAPPKPAPPVTAKAPAARRGRASVIAETIAWSLMATLSILIAAYYLGLSIDL